MLFLTRRTLLQALLAQSISSGTADAPAVVHRAPRPLALEAVTHDWAASLGPSHNAVSTETPLRRFLPPPLLWEWPTGSGACSSLPAPSSRFGPTSRTASSGRRRSSGCSSTRRSTETATSTASTERARGTRRSPASTPPPERSSGVRLGRGPRRFRSTGARGSWGWASLGGAACGRRAVSLPRRVRSPVLAGSHAAGLRGDLAHMALRGAGIVDLAGAQPGLALRQAEHAGPASRLPPRLLCYDLRGGRTAPPRPRA